MTTPTSHQRSMQFLKTILLLDAATGIVMGALLLLAGDWLAAKLVLPQPLLLWAGVSLFPSAALMVLAAWRAADWPALVWAVVVGNAGWVVGSVMCAAILPANALGIAFLVGQAVAVAGLAALEAAGVLRLGRGTTVPA